MVDEIDYFVLMLWNFFDQEFCNLLLVLHQHCSTNRVLGTYLTVDEIDYFVPMP
jgi:hypothetical protein